MRVVDYSSARPKIHDLLSGGVTGVSRYLSFVTSKTKSKIITKDEFDALIAAGIAVVLNWEFEDDDFVKHGFDARAAAREALRQARALGYPDRHAIYFSVDFDAKEDDWPTIRDRLRQVNAEIGLARTGVYGPSDVLRWAKRDGVASWFWQAGLSTAWSEGRNAKLWPGAHLFQRVNRPIGGADCDDDDIIQAYYGQFGGEDMEELTRLGGNADRWGRAMITGEQPAHFLGGDGVERPTTNLLHQKLDALVTSTAADLAEDRAATMAITALGSQLAAVGGKIDLAPVIAEIRAARTEESAAVTALQQQNEALAAELAAARRQLEDLRRQVAQGVPPP
jgi:Rv2525c-like, glycoside hydrolase-like domain